MPIYFDATFSWSGYSYQGKVGMFIVLKKLNEYNGCKISDNVSTCFTFMFPFFQTSFKSVKL